MKAGIFTDKATLALDRYQEFAEDTVKHYKNKRKVYDYPPEHPQFKIIVTKNSEGKNQFYAIEPDNETTILGEGQSIVYLGVNLKTGEKVAIKKLKPNGPGALEDLLREREHLQTKNELIGEAEEQEKNNFNPTYYTIMKLIPGKSLIDELYENNAKKESTLRELVGKKESNQHLWRIVHLAAFEQTN